MTGLQESFYIIGIVYMAISLLLIIGVVIALGVIRKKVVSLENIVKDKVDMVASVGARAGEIVGVVKKMTHRGK